MTVGVVLMTYGAPANDADLPRYLTAVRGGRAPEDDVVREMARRYRLIGGSPLVAWTRRQAAALEVALADHGDYRVAAGMRFSEPSIDSAVSDVIDAGAERIVGLCLSPQWSDGLMGGYERALREALTKRPEIAATMIGAWHRAPEFVHAIAESIRDALAGLATSATLPVLLTAHSLPRRVFDTEPGYIAQLRETAELVADAVPLAPARWRWAYQSAGHSREEWLRPDLTELFPDLVREGHRDVLVAPVQFLSDHLEVLYDLDVAAAAQADAVGLRYHRMAMPNIRPSFVAALAAIVTRSAASIAAR